MCPAWCRSWELQALMKSANRIPNHLSALGSAWTPWVSSVPGLTGSSSRLNTLQSFSPGNVAADEESRYTAGAA